MMNSPETMKKPRRLWLRILKYLGVGVGFLIIAALATEALLKYHDAGKYPMPGRLVDIGSHQMHWWCEGQGSPTVILDAGAIAFSTSWRQLMPLISGQTRVCAFDRSGMGWSEPGPGPWDADQAAFELAALLDAAGEEDPVIYVGHSLGAMLARVFATHYPERLDGLLLIEPADPEIIIRDFNQERDEPLHANMPDPDCGKRCTMAAVAGVLGMPRWMLRTQEILQDPKLPQRAVNEFVARTVATDNLQHLVMMGRYFPRIFFQTLDNRSLADIPVIMGYGTHSGQLLGDHKDMNEWKSDHEETLLAWQKTGELSSNFLGMRVVDGANHLSIVTYPEYAEGIATMVEELLAFSRNGMHSGLD
jgi:pimeloyl-ACP methyl ester carboxylesterase